MSVHIVEPFLASEDRGLPHAEPCPSCRERPPYTAAEIAAREDVMGRLGRRGQARPEAPKQPARTMPGSDEMKVRYDEPMEEP